MCSEPCCGCAELIYLNDKINELTSSFRAVNDYHNRLNSRLSELSSIMGKYMNMSVPKQNQANTLALNIKTDHDNKILNDNKVLNPGVKLNVTVNKENHV